MDDISPRLKIVNFSGGKDSTYMLLEMIRRDMPFDMVLNVDTGMEFPPMYEHIDKVDQFLQAERGMSITRLRPPHSFEDLMFHAVKEAKPYEPIGYGWPNIKVRWCTGQLKTHVIEMYLRSLSLRPYQYIAFAADETYRLQRENNLSEYKLYPLIEWGITEAQALAGSYQAGYTWGGLYETFSRVSCWCCPLQSLEELRALRKFYPEVWAKLRDMDDRAIQQFGKESPYGQFRKNESIRMLESRFDFERDWKEKGGNIRSRAFYHRLKRLYQQKFYPEGHYFTGPQQPKADADSLLPFVIPEDLDSLYLPCLQPDPRSKHIKKKQKKHRLDR